ncbi:MAG: phenylalanine--tRNA ligase subunit beta [Nanoarchaeota archaeon]|nr:phenylalanine--tRNA ligase subunit beta [Nanoarchaeota archaeon]MBU1704052.1 phenylalanine--tRNA ligase subunit beta [Nanoarchaeota archaeon]
MPTITFALKDLEKLVGRKLKIEQVEELSGYGKGDYEGYDNETDEVKIDFGDTNLPYLWSVEGVARLFKRVLGIEKGIAKLDSKKSGYQVKVDNSVGKIRPYISAFVAEGKKIDDYLLKQLIQLQEKLCENFGRKRQKVAIGIYSHKQIKFPVHYKATDPESISFVPLEFKREMTQAEILESHPKGKDYAWILDGFSKYPILVDDQGNVLSFPPIINSNSTGKIEIGEDQIFFEATGLDMDSVHLATNIFAQALSDRGFSIGSVEVQYADKKITTPFMFNEVVELDKERIKSVLGLELKDSEIKKLVENAGYNFASGKVQIPHYRRDILHQVDVIEDIGIMYGYDNIKEKPLVSYTVGGSLPIVALIDKAREVMVGLGCQEIMSPILSNKFTLYNQMNIKDFGTVEIKAYMSENYSVVRTWLIPILFECLSKNKHVEYPQKIFEQGLVTVRKDDEAIDHERLAYASANEKADYTEVKQVLDYLLRMLNVQYSIEETEHDSFIAGRVGRVIVDGKKVGFIGEVAPVVLIKWGIELPVAAFEINLTEIFEVK